MDRPPEIAPRGLGRALRDLRARILALNLRAHRRLLGGVAAIAISIGLGVLANDLSGESSLRDWISRHPPDPRAWKAALESRGLGLPAKQSVLNASLRSLPYSADDRGSVWVAEDGLWVAVFKADSGADPVLVECVRCDSPPRQWVPAGQGWPALESVLAWLDPRIARLKRPVPVHRAVSWEDPREFHY